MEKQYKITEKCGYYTVENANGPVLGMANVKIKEQNGFAFKNLSGKDELLPYEDWRLTAEERAKDLAMRLSIQAIAGLMLWSPHQMVPFRPGMPFRGHYDGGEFRPGMAPDTLTDEQKAMLAPTAQTMGLDPMTMTDEQWMEVAMAAQSGTEAGAPADPEASLAILEEMGIDPSTLSEEQLAYLSTMTPEQIKMMMESYAASTTNTYEGNLRKFGVAELGTPSGIMIFPKSFEAKEESISGVIATTDEETRKLLSENLGLFVFRL